MKKYVRFLLLALTLMLILPASAPAQSACSPIDPTDEELAAANLFLSNFTEIGIDSIKSWHEDIDLVDFAHDHIWFNDNDAYEYGEYFADNNCRVSDDDIQRLVDKYFYDPHEVDLTQTRFDYRDGYYYHCETGGWNDSGFAYTVGAYPIGDDKYFVYFLNFCSGEPWENDVLDNDLDAIIEKYDDPLAYGSATVYAEDLADRSTYKMISYTLV